MLRPQSFATFSRLLVAITGDALIAAGAVAAVVLLRTHVDLPLTRDLLPPGKFPLDARNLLVFAATLVAALGISGFLDFRVSPRHRPTLFVALPLQMAMVAVAGTLLEASWPRTVFVAVPFLEAGAILLWRKIIARLWRERRRTAVLVGEPEALRAFTTKLPEWLTLTGIVSVRDPFEHPAYVGQLGDEPSAKAIDAADELIDAGGALAPGRRALLLHLRGPRGYLFASAVSDALVSGTPFGFVGDHPVAEVSMPGAYGLGAASKRAFDIVVGGLMLLLASPAIAIAAVLVAIDSRGGILFRQERAGLRGKPFIMLKFRTMRVDDPAGALIRDRVTRVGGWLRRYRLDELPQFVNVVRGDMSLVGPRPEMLSKIEIIRETVPDFDLRLFVRPGIAGLAQTSAEYDQAPSVKLTYDLQYLCSWTLLLDVMILLRAVPTALSGRGV
jgi:lipopolysaccharide/colanic/teichoic acid biosynthesis glycosyltransferase